MAMIFNKGKLYAKRIIIGLVIIACLIFCLMFAKGCQARNVQAELTIEALSSTLKKTIDKTGVETAEKRLIQIDYQTLKKMRVADSSEIGRLQKLVNKKTISATIIKTATSGTLTSHSVSVTFGNNKNSLPKDTAQSEAFGFPCDTIYATYADTLHDKWSTLSITACKDSINAVYQIINEFEFKQENKKEGNWPFKKEVPVVSVRSLNPNTTTTGLSSYAVPTPDHKKRNATIGTVCLALGFIAGILIVK